MSGHEDTAFRRIAAILVIATLLAVFLWSRPRENPQERGVPTTSSIGSGAQPTADSQLEVASEPIPRSTAQPLPMSTRTEAGESHTGTLVVSVTAGGRPVRQGRIKIGRGQKDVLLDACESSIDHQTGQARFERLRPGKYRLVRLEDLPGGWIAPRGDYSSTDPRIVWNVPTGVSRVELALEGTARVFGTVAHSNGVSFDAELTFTPLDESGARRERGTVIQSHDGNYEGELRSGLWLVEVGDNEIVSGFERSPRPQIHRLDPGSRTQVDFRAEPGSGRIIGRVRDNAGADFNEIDVSADRLLTMEIPGSDRTIELEFAVDGSGTDPDGGFGMQLLPQGRYRVHVAWNGFDPFDSQGQNKVGGIDRGKVVEVVGSDPVHVELVACRPRVVRVSVDVVVDEGWRASHAVPTLLPAVRFVTDDRWENGMEIARSLGAKKTRYELCFEAALASPRFELKLGETTATYPIVVGDSSDKLNVSLRFPW